jgi:dihydrofolate reductase
MDLQFFKSVTMGSPILAGRTTRDTLPKKGLPKRPTLTLTRSPTAALEFSSIELAANWCALNDHDKLFLIGGRSVYSLGLKYCRHLYLTIVQQVVEGDVMFPGYDPELWSVVSLQEQVYDFQSKTKRSVYVLKNTRPEILCPVFDF